MSSQVCEQPPSTNIDPERQWLAGIQAISLGDIATQATFFIDNPWRQNRSRNRLAELDDSIQLAVFLDAVGPLPDGTVSEALDSLAVVGNADEVALESLARTVNIFRANRDDARLIHRHRTDTIKARFANMPVEDVIAKTSKDTYLAALANDFGWSQTSILHYCSMFNKQLASQQLNLQPVRQEYYASGTRMRTGLFLPNMQAIGLRLGFNAALEATGRTKDDVPFSTRDLATLQSEAHIRLRSGSLSWRNVELWSSVSRCITGDSDSFMNAYNEELKGADRKKVERLAIFQCAACPVRSMCADYDLILANKNIKRWGVWGGLSARDRTKARLLANMFAFELSGQELDDIYKEDLDRIGYGVDVVQDRSTHSDEEPDDEQTASELE